MRLKLAIFLLLPMISFGQYYPVKSFDTTYPEGVGFRSGIMPNATLIREVVIDPDASNIITGLGITSDVDRIAINDFVKSTKSSGVWDKCHAIYGFYGSDSTTQKYNWKNPTKADAHYLVHGGTITYNSSGAKGSANGYFDTKINAKTGLDSSNYHVSVYYKKDTLHNSVLWGAQTASPDKLIQCAPWYNYLGGTTINDLPTRVIHSQTNSTGFWLSEKRSGVAIEYLDGVRTGNIGSEASSLPNEEIYILAKNNDGSATASVPGTIAFASIGQGLTDYQAFSLNTSVQDLLTVLGRKNDTVAGRYRKFNIQTADNSIIDNGTFTPHTSDGSYFNEWDNLKIGALICFNIESFGYNLQHPVPVSPYAFTADSVNVEAWVDSLKANNIKYACLTITAEMGYSLLDVPFDFDETIIADGTIRKYDVGNSPQADRNFVDEFFSMCADSGIVAIPYLCLSGNFNLTVSMAGWSTAQKEKYTNYQSRLLQYIIQKYGCKYVWLDNYNAFNFQNIYDAVKSADPNCLVISNCVGDTLFNKFPYDIGSNEEFYSFDTSADSVVLSTERTHNGTTYFVPQEVVTNITGVKGTSYYYSGSAVVPRDQSEIQSIYDRAKAQNSNFLLSVIPDRDGAISTSQWAVFRNLTR